MPGSFFFSEGDIDFLSHYRLVDSRKLEPYARAFVVEDIDFDTIIGSRVHIPFSNRDTYFNFNVCAKLIERSFGSIFNNLALQNVRNNIIICTVGNFLPHFVIFLTLQV